MLVSVSVPISVAGGRLSIKIDGYSARRCRIVRRIEAGTAVKRVTISVQPGDQRVIAAFTEKLVSTYPTVKCIIAAATS